MVLAPRFRRMYPGTCILAHVCCRTCTDAIDIKVFGISAFDISAFGSDTWFQSAGSEILHKCTAPPGFTPGARLHAWRMASRSAHGFMLRARLHAPRTASAWSQRFLQYYHHDKVGDQNKPRYPVFTAPVKGPHLGPSFTAVVAAGFHGHRQV